MTQALSFFPKGFLSVGIAEKLQNVIAPFFGSSVNVPLYPFTIEICM